MMLPLVPFMARRAVEDVSAALGAGDEMGSEQLVIRDVIGKVRPST